MIFDDPADQSVTPQAFELMYFIVEKRLELGRLTVADATNLKREHRTRLSRIAKKFQFNTTAILFNAPIENCLARNAARKRRVPEEAVMNQYVLLEGTLRTIENEAFNSVHVLDEAAQSNIEVRIGRYVSRPPQRLAP